MSRTDAFNKFENACDMQQKMMDLMTKDMYEETKWTYNTEKKYFTFNTENENIKYGDIENIITTINLNDKSNIKIKNLYIESELLLKSGLHILPLPRFISSNAELIIIAPENSEIITYNIPFIRNVKNHTNFINQTQTYKDGIYNKMIIGGMFVNKITVNINEKNLENLKNIELYINPSISMGMFSADVKKIIKIGIINIIKGEGEGEGEIVFNKYMHPSEVEYYKMKPIYENEEREENNKNFIIEVTFHGYNQLLESITTTNNKSNIIMYGHKYST